MGGELGRTGGVGCAINLGLVEKGVGEMTVPGVTGI
jgi:hypothetical protein